MSIFLMFGRYNPESLEGISAERTEKAVEAIKRHGGDVKSMYAVMGEDDLVFTVDFPNSEAAMASSVELQKITGITFRTSPVVEVEKFDRLVGKAEKI